MAEHAGPVAKPDAISAPPSARGMANGPLAEAGQRLNARPAVVAQPVQALAATGERLNGGPAVTAQRALGARLAAGSGGAPIQGKFRFMGGVLDNKELLKEPVPPRIVPFITSETIYDVRDDWDVDFAKPLYLIDPGTVYLLGEIHNASQWTAQTKKWSRIPKMLEGNKSFPGFEDESPDPQDQVLESMNAYLLHVALIARSEILKLKADGNAVPAVGPVDELIWAFGQILASKKTYENLMKAIVDDELVEEHPKEAEFLVKMLDKPNYMLNASVAHQVATTLKAKIAIVPATADSREAIKDCRDLLNGEMPALRGMIAALATVNGLKKTGAMGKPVADEAASDAPVAPKDSAAMQVREKFMVQNIKAAARPLLVKIGDGHVVAVGGQVSNSVTIRAGDTLAKHTKR